MLVKKIVSCAGHADSRETLDKKRKHAIQNDDKFYRKAQRFAPYLFYTILLLRQLNMSKDVMPDLTRDLA